MLMNHKGTKNSKKAEKTGIQALQISSLFDYLPACRQSRLAGKQLLLLQTPVSLCPLCLCGLT
jgi:hypothetical protein